MLGSTQQNNGKIYILKIKNKSKDAKSVPAFFEVTEKVEKGKWIVSSNPQYRVSGDLTRITFSKGKWDDQEYDVVKIFLTDFEQNETYLLDLRLTLLTRSLFNSLLSLESFENISMSLYQNKRGDDSYDAVCVRQGDKLVNWKYKLDELPEVKIHKISGKKIVDTEELDSFYLSGLQELASKIGKGKKTSTFSVGPSQTDEGGSSTNIQEEEDIF